MTIARQPAVPPPSRAYQFTLRTLLLLFVVLGSSLAVLGAWGIVIFGLVAGSRLRLRVGLGSTGYGRRVLTVRRLPPAPQWTPQPQTESPTVSVDHRKPPITIACPQCGGTNSFDQPYRYHAGFSDQGFLYNDAGNLTLVWSWYDPAYKAIVGEGNPPDRLTTDQQRLFEAQLLPAPIGGAFRFKNPARCVHCGHPISAPMPDEIYYVVYPNSLITDPGPMQLKRLLLEPKRE